MDLIKLIKSRRTIHTYNSSLVSEDLLHQALELALWAPNHKLTFPWRFIKVGPETRRQLLQIATEIKAKKNGGTLSGLEQSALEKNYLTPSHLIVLAMDKSADFNRWQEDYASVAMGVQNISLFLWQHQVGTKWSSGAPTRDPRTYEMLQINAETQQIVGFLWVGYFAETPAEKKRPELRQALVVKP